MTIIGKYYKFQRDFYKSMKIKNKISLIVILVVLIVSVLVSLLFVKEQNQMKSSDIYKNKETKVKLRPYNMPAQLATVDTVKSYLLANFFKNNSLVDDGAWLNKNQKISTNNMVSPIDGIFSFQNDIPIIYYPESRISFYVTENEISNISIGMPLNFQLISNPEIKGNTTIASISAVPINKNGSISKYKVISEILDQSKLDLRKVKFGQYLSVKILSHEFILPKKMIQKNNVITAKLSNKWTKVHVKINKVIDNNVLISPSGELHVGMEVKK